MKPITLLTAALTAMAFALISCDKHSDLSHDHDGDGIADHSAEAHNAPVPHDHDGDGVPDHGPGAHHDHPPIEAGPNGGKILTAPDFSSEFLITADRKVQVTFLDKENKPVALESQVVSLEGGDRSNPTQLTFSKAPDGKSLISSGSLPEGDRLPVFLTVKLTPDAEAARARITVDLTDCTTCKRQKYACTCCKH